MLFRSSLHVRRELLGGDHPQDHLAPFNLEAAVVLYSRRAAADRETRGILRSGQESLQVRLDLRLVVTATAAARQLRRGERQNPSKRDEPQAHRFQRRGGRVLRCRIEWMAGASTRSSAAATPRQASWWIRFVDMSVRSLRLVIAVASR